MTRPPSGSRSARVRRMLADLGRAETRGDAMRRIRRRLGSEVRTRIGLARPGPAAPGGGAGRPPAWHAMAWSRLAAAVLGPEESVGERSAAWSADRARAAAAISEAGRHRAASTLADAVARGEPLERAVAESVAALAGAIEWESAWSLAEGAGRLPGGATASMIGHGVLLHRRRQFGRAWMTLSALDDATLNAYVPVEAVDAALGSMNADGAGTEDRAVVRRRAIAIGSPTPSMDAATIIDLASRFLAFGERDRTADLLAEIDQRLADDVAALDPRRRHLRDLIGRWLEAGPVAVPPGAIPVAVLDYQSPDHVLTSGNLGDYVQTLSMLGNLARLSGVAFTGEDGLGAFATELQARVRPELRVPDAGAAIHLIGVDRDFSGAEAIPPGTWMIAFGWHMHPLFDLRYDFPYHPNILPLFLSFHVNRLDMLSDEALAYLRRHGPVGCRDWNTVYLLLSAGVDAFFSGCLTTTIDTIYPTRAEAYSGGGAIGVIDLPAHVAGAGAQSVLVYGHQADATALMTLTEGLRAADTALAGYQRDLSRAITNRLHAYLPLTSLGVPVDFRPGRPGDVRFAGLVGLEPGGERIREISGGIRDLIASALVAVVSGAEPAAVRTLWRDLTRDALAEARSRFEAPAPTVPLTIDVRSAVATTLAGSRRFGPQAPADRDTVTDVVLAFDQNLLWPAAVMIESMVENASGPLRVWVLGRGLPAGYVEWLAAAFPSVALTVLPCDDISFGPKGRPHRIPARITISTMDRLLLPDLLPGVRRVVYLDVDTLVLDDVCVLARTDLGGRPLAGRDTNVSATFGWQSALRPMPEPVATDFRRAMAHRHGFGGAALNAGVLVLDLERMRRDDFSRTYLPLVERYGLHDQDVILAYVGPDRATIDARWNAMPVLEDVRAPSLIHWAAFAKPWDAPLTFGQDLWHEYADRLASRAGRPPGADEAAAQVGSLRNPHPVEPATRPLSPAIERVIRAVRAEHLSYLDVVGLRNLAATVQSIEAERIPGLIIETGAARGGSAIALAAAKATARRMKVYDVFGMIPPPSDKDGEDVHRRYETIASGDSQGVGGETYYGYRDDLLTEVTESFARHGLAIGDANVELIRGLFEDTIDLQEPVALAHLDGDWYESTMTCLTRITPLLSIGGRLVIDDYDLWSGCRAAVDEYFAGRPGFRFERRGRLHIVRV